MRILCTTIFRPLLRLYSFFLNDYSLNVVRVFAHSKLVSTTNHTVGPMSNFGLVAKFPPCLGGISVKGVK